MNNDSVFLNREIGSRSRKIFQPARKYYSLLLLASYCASFHLDFPHGATLRTWERTPVSNFIQITPFMHVENLDRALDFFTRILGFEVPYRRRADYAYIRRETAAIRILQHKGDADAPGPGNRRFAYYIDVRDVDQLYNELKPKLDTLPKGDVYGPVNQSYGQRELLVLAPDNNLIAFGEEINVH
jgi:catechol 2,3-dioxygenase-like lactoylglutathione lyase family enzyme